MIKKVLLPISFISVSLSVFSGDTIPRTLPESTIRFPGGNYGHVAVSGNLAVTCSGWSREDTAGVFDISNPSAVKFLARFPAKGYSLASPVFFKNRCYVPNGFSATVIDLTNPSEPRLEGYLNPSFPKNGCSQLWIEDGELFFKADDGCRKVESDGFSSVAVEKTPPKETKQSECSVRLEDSMLKTDSCEVPFVYNLSSIAVKDGTAFIWAQHAGCSEARLLSLDVSSSGSRLFSSFAKGASIPKHCRYMTMGMQTAGSVSRRDNLFFADDGIFRLDRKGKFETLLARTKPASNSSIDGDRIALAQCSRCRVIDFSDLNNVFIRDFVPPADHPLHITGCDLKGKDLFVAYTLVEEKGMDFIYKFPTRGYVAHFDLEGTVKPTNVIETFPCIAMTRVGDYLYLTGRKGKFGVIDASNPVAMSLKKVRDDLLDGDGYKVKNAEGRVFLLNGKRILELDVADPAVPKAAHVYERGPGTSAPSYDDFTIDGLRLYALAHASVDVFILDDPERTAEVPDDIGVKGVKSVLDPVEASVFKGHVPVAKPADTLRFRAGRFDNYFGAYVFDYAELPDGRFAVAYGEGGLVLCDKDGTFISELPRGEWGAQIFAAEVVYDNGILFVMDGEGKTYSVKPEVF